MTTPTPPVRASRPDSARVIERRARALRLASRAAAAVVSVGGLLVLLGWQFDVQALRAIGPVDVVMNPLSALLFVLAGSVLLLDGSRRSPDVARVWGAACGLLIALCGGLVLMRTVAGWQVGVDDLLFREQVLGVTPPDWMAENAALSFLLLGLALLARNVREPRGWRPAHWLLLPVALISLLVVIGYLYGTAGFITFQMQLPMALNTAFFFLAASFALVAAHPNEGAMALFVSDSTGGKITRRLLPALLLVPLFLGAVIDLGLRAGWYGPTLALALFTLATIVLSVLLTVTTAGALHRSDLALRRSEERVRLIIENSSDVATILDAQGVNRYQSPSIERVLGYKAEELVGGNAFDRIHPDDHEACRAALGAMFRNPGTTHTVEFRYRHGDGSWRVLEAAGRTLLPDSAAEGVIINSRDVTERKQAEGELRHTTRFLENLIASSPGVIFRAAGDPFQLTYISPNAEAVLGYSAKQFLLDPGLWLERTNPKDRQDIAARISQAIERGDSDMSYEYCFLHRDDTYRTLLASVRFERDPTTGAVEILGYTFDITRLKDTEARLRKAMEEAESANRAKSDFLSRMSHELRTPMNSILGFAQLLEMGELPPNQRRAVDRIHKAGKHLLNLINEVLDLARIESGRYSLSLEPVQLGLVLKEALSLIRPLAAQRNCRLPEELPPQADGYVQADRQRLTQVLLNLLSNAVKYNRPGGEVMVHIDAVTADSGEEIVRVGVRDRGPGIPKEKMDELFQPFSRLGAEDSEVEGTGLGLALSKSLVEAMNGRLVAESEPGEGSTFWVELPPASDPLRDRPTGVTAGAQPSAELSSRPATLLYIEDNTANLALIKELLLAYPEITLHCAQQGRLGLDLAREHGPDLVLLDLHLPDLPGEEVLRHLRAEPKTRDIPVIVLSADATPAQIEHLRSAGAREYLTKPLDLTQLIAVLTEVLSERPIPDGALPAH